MASENATLARQGGAYGIGDSAVQSDLLPVTEHDPLNADEQSLTGVPLRSDLETDMSADIDSDRGGVDNFYIDTDPGFAPVENDTEPIALNENDTPIQEPEEVTDAAKQALASVADAAKTQVSQVADQARTQVSALTAKATDTVKEQIGVQKGKAADNLGSISQVFHQTGDNLSQNGQEQFGTVAHSLAGKIDDVTDYLRNKDIDQIADEITGYAKQNPQLFIGGAFLLGVAFARFLKSSQRTDVASA